MTTTMANVIERYDENQQGAQNDDASAAPAQVIQGAFAPSQSERYRRAVMDRLDEARTGPDAIGLGHLVSRVLGGLPSRVERAFRDYERTHDLREVAQRLGADLDETANLLERALEVVDEALERASH